MDETKKGLSDNVTTNESESIQSLPSFGFFLFCMTVVGSITIVLPFLMASSH